jgi:hypothetical protein
VAGGSLDRIDAAGKPLECVDAVDRLVHEDAAVRVPGATPPARIEVALRAEPLDVGILEDEVADHVVLDSAFRTEDVRTGPGDFDGDVGAGQTDPGTAHDGVSYHARTPRNERYDYGPRRCPPVRVQTIEKW